MLPRIVSGPPTLTERLGYLLSDLQVASIHFIMFSLAPRSDVCFRCFLFMPPSPSPTLVVGEHPLPVVIRSFVFHLVSVNPLPSPLPLSPLGGLPCFVCFANLEKVSVNEHPCIISLKRLARVPYYLPGVVGIDRIAKKIRTLNSVASMRRRLYNTAIHIPASPTPIPPHDGRIGSNQDKVS